MSISKIYKSINVIGILILMAITSSCSDNVVGVEGYCPIVESTTPTNLETDVLGNTVVTVTFEEKINPATMIPAAFTLTNVVTDNSTGTPVNQTIEINGSMTFNNDTNTMSFTPNAPLDYNTVYTGTVKNSIKDPLGNQMLENYVWTFTIEAPATFTLDVTAENGSVTKTPDQESYDDGSQVVLIATPAEGYTFTSWSGDATGTENSLTVNMDSNKSIKANFTAIPVIPDDAYTLNVTAENGSVTKNPDQQSYSDGSQVVLTPTANEGFVFTSWSGDATGSDNPLTVTMNANKNITANFTAIAAGTFTLNVSAVNGSVSKNPNQQSYSDGSQVVLTPTANDGYVFSSWSGDATGSDNPLTVTMNANKNITANFTAVAAATFTLNVTAVNGSVSKNPDQQSYNDGLQVVLTPTANEGFVFSSWSGDATGSDNPLTVTMNANKNITANFTAIAAATFTLNVTAVNGSVSKNPDQQSYNDGSQVVLTPTANEGYVFSSWSGDATGSDNPLTVTMNANKNITANFTEEAAKIVVNLGRAARFGAYGGSAGVTNQGINTVVNGSLGTIGASTLITGFHDELTNAVYTETTLNIGAVTNGIFTAPPAPGTADSQKIAEDARLDAIAARNSISPGTLPGGTDLGTDELGGLTLEEGIYKSATGSYKISDVDLTLDAKGNANAVWVFQAESSLTVGTPTGPRSIILKNGALPKNVFWFVGSAATINGAGGGTMVGTILSDAGVTFSTAGNGAQTVLNGRAISITASVTMVNTTINVPE